MLREHHDNLIKLERHLDALPADYQHFDMWFYNSEVPTPCIINTKCGAVACAVGHGPAAGIPVVGDEGWNEYCERVFGVNGDNDSDEYRYLFAGTWACHDNTPQGAAARIRKYLALGGKAPDGWTYTDQEKTA